MGTTINAAQLSRMFMAAAKNLEANRDVINELNVFPVPDGDTGTNMTMTIMSAVKEVSPLGEEADMKTICKAISSGSLRGARGNSGVILSQLLRGFCKVIRDYDEVSIPLLADACDRAVETAYKAVMKPKEGTILTVARGASEKARELTEAGVEDYDEFLPQVIAHTETVLEGTPDLLPVLKQAGVVDSGGRGLLEVLKGAYMAYSGHEIDYAEIVKSAEASEQKKNAGKEEPAHRNLKYGYHASFLVLLEKIFTKNEEKEFLAYLGSIGEEISCNVSEKQIRVEIDTNNPGLAIQRGILYGQLADIAVDNLKLSEEDLAKLQKPEKEQEAPEEESLPRKEVGFIAVSVGDGMEEIFRGLGVDYVLSGGQTMNPSTEDILNAIDKVNASTIFILPNNKNIIMAANQAAELMTTKRIIVIPTKTIPQGITAVINYMPDVDPDICRDNMLEEIARVKTVEVTYSIRDTVIDDQEIREGDRMAIGDNGILCVGEDINETALKAMEKAVSEETEIISIYYGSDIEEKQAEQLQVQLSKMYPEMDIELQRGGQPIYYYILSAE